MSFFCKILVFLSINFGCDNATYYPSPGRGIEFAHSNLQEFTPQKDPSFHEKHFEGVYQSWLGLWQVSISHIITANQLSVVVRKALVTHVSGFKATAQNHKFSGHSSWLGWLSLFSFLLFGWRDGLGLKMWLFHGDGEMGVGSIDWKKYLDFARGSWAM